MKLKHRLQIRFVLLAALALLVTQVLIVGMSLNLSYQKMCLRADELILQISKDPAAAGDVRYFKVTKVGDTVEADVSHTALVTRQKAVACAQQVLSSGKSRGYLDDYRFLVHRGEKEISITFLSSIITHRAFQKNAALLIEVSLGGVAMMTLFLSLISARVVEPLVKNREKQKEFITSASHALKTPVTVVQADAQMLELETGESEWLSDILLQTKRMTDMTQRLVYLSRLEEQEKKMEKMNFPLSDALRQVCESFRGIATGSGKHFQVNITPGIAFCGDERAIREMMNVLLDNAFKYVAPTGTIQVRVEREGRYVKITVENTVANMKPEQLEHLTGRFARGSDQPGGFGIGLSVAQAVTENHRGKLVLELPEGNVFRVTALLR